jgi:hypothetical protein
VAYAPNGNRNVDQPLRKHDSNRPQHIPDGSGEKSPRGVQPPIKSDKLCDSISTQGPDDGEGDKQVIYTFGTRHRNPEAEGEDLQRRENETRDATEEADMITKERFARAQHYIALEQELIRAQTGVASERAKYREEIQRLHSLLARSHSHAASLEQKLADMRIQQSVCRCGSYNVIIRK